MENPGDELLSKEFLTKLERLELQSRKVLSGKLKGERRSKRRGASVEFADHRGYVAGDDLRFIDWNILIRLDRLFIKLFEEEEDRAVHILLDASKSMDFGEPTKFRLAKQLAASLSAIGLFGLDRVQVGTLGADLKILSAPARGKSALWRTLRMIDAIQIDDATDLSRSLRTFSLRNPAKGIVVVLSDFLDRNGFADGLRYLSATQLDCFVLQILSREELAPELVGDLRLLDCEDGNEAEVSISEPLLQRYRANLNAFLEDLRSTCLKREMVHQLATNTTSVETLVLDFLRSRGVVR